MSEHTQQVEAKGDILFTISTTRNEVILTDQNSGQEFTEVLLGTDLDESLLEQKIRSLVSQAIQAQG